MKIIPIIFAGVLVSALNAQVAKNTEPENFEEKVSYAVGYDVTRSLLKMDVDLKKKWMVQGILDALKDSTGKPLMTDDEMELVFQELKQKNMMAQENQQLELSAPNRKKGQEYATKEMANNSEMKKTTTGLVYLEIKKGTGKKPTIENKVSVKYKGYLIDGTVFDQTQESPATFGVNQVIPGWTEGLQLMQEGSIFKLIIPAELAYGNNPPPQTPIEPGSTLVFEVELIKVLQ